jgi:TonB-dependent starch-binding outer membrane protein SusC
MHYPQLCFAHSVREEIILNLNPNQMIMKKLYRCLSLAAALMLLFTSVALAQERVVTGAITDENGNSMPGVNILLKGTSQGTATDAEGKFSMSVPNDQATLVISFVGYATTEVVVGSRTNIAIQMSPDVTTLNELVVTGYAIQEKKDVTGSVGVVKPKELTSIPTGNVSNQLQGRVAGVTVTGSGQPGQTSVVRIRGLGSFQNNDPLYVVDGVPTQDISTLNPNDVESITVLKDAGAASIYGARASNGVIVVTTKTGVTSGVKVNYNMYVGNQYPGKGPDNLLNTQEYADLQWLVYENDGTSETHPVYGPSSQATPSIPSWAADTDWYDEITDVASIQNHDLSLSGGNENSKFYAGLNYFKQNGIVLTNYTQRFSARINSEFKVKDRVTFGENLTVTHRSGLSVGNLDEGSPINAAVYRMQPIIPVRITDPIAGIAHNFVPGEYGGTGIAPRLGNGGNTVAALERNQDDNGFDMRLLGSLYGDVKILEGLNFKTTFGGTFGQYYYSDYNFATYENAENVGTASLNEGGGYGNDWVWTNTLTFNKKFGDHSLLVVGGYEAVKGNIYRNLNGTRAGYFSDAVSYRTLTNGASTTGLNSSLGTPRTLVSTFARVDYSFLDKYLLSATVRRDGASVFGPDTKYGTFPSVTAAWRVSQESFLAGNELISDLKVRAGYGTMGNQLPVSPQSQYFLFSGAVGETAYPIEGNATSSSQGFRPSQIGNANAKWETNVSTNVGIDLAMLDNRLELVFDWYKKDTEDLLFNPELPGIAGGASPPYVNVGEMSNTGIDLQLIYRQTFDNSLKFEGNVTFTTYSNEIKKVTSDQTYFDAGGSRIGAFNRNQAGQAVGAFYGYQVVGLWQSDAEVAEANALDGDATSPFQDGAEAGFFRLADIDGNGLIDADDRTFIGNPNPDFTYGLNLSLEYKGFDLTTFFYGSKGNEIFNYNKWWTDFWPSFQGQKSRELLYDSWTPERGGNSVPKASNKSNLSTNTAGNSYYIEDGSFLRMRNIQIGYNIPVNTANKIGLSSARIYIQGINLFTATKYSGLDPEISKPSYENDTARGVDAGNYPAVKQMLIGINLGI